MWQTSVGDRHLVGHEAALVRASLEALADQVCELVESEREGPTGRSANAPGTFDSLSGTQQLALLYQVAHHLLHDAPLALPLTAVSESAIAAIFDQIRSGVELEIDGQLEGCDRDERFADLPSWRELILAAHQETLAEDEREQWIAQERDYPAADDTDPEQWESLIETLLDRILWDRDYELEPLLLDMDPDKAADTKQRLGIEEDHYSEPAPDARDCDTDMLLAKIRAITAEKQ